MADQQDEDKQEVTDMKCMECGGASYILRDDSEPGIVVICDQCNALMGRFTQLGPVER